MSEAHRRVLRALAQDAVSQVALSARDGLRGMPAGLSGDDSGLNTAWEEFCVQVQGEESFCWDEYVDTAKQCIEGALHGIDRHRLQAMWLLSDAGEEWSSDEEPDPPDPPVFQDDVVEVVYSSVWQLADQDTSALVRRFLDRDAERDSEEDDGEGNQDEDEDSKEEDISGEVPKGEN